MNPSNAHPNPDVIAAFAAGKLSEADSAEIELHVVVCEACSRLLQQQPEDPLITLARGGPPPS